MLLQFRLQSQSGTKTIPMLKIAKTLFCFFISYTAFAQQLPLFTQYRDNQGVLNPASISYNYYLNQENITIGASYRKQWATLNNSPTTQVLRGEWITSNNRSFNLLTGGYIMNDQTGPTGFTGLYGRIGALLSEDPEQGGFAVGLSLGVVQYRVNVSKLRFHDAGDVEGMVDQNKIFPDAGLGAYYYRQMNTGNGRNDYFYSGVSIPQLFGLNLQFKDTDGQFATKRIQHFYGMAGWIHYLTDESYLEPSVWAKYAPNAPFNADINLKYQMNNVFWLGTGISLGKMFHAETGVVLGEDLDMGGTIKIGYGFDYSFNTFGPFAGSTHEFNLSYSFGNK